MSVKRVVSILLALALVSSTASSGSPPVGSIEYKAIPEKKALMIESLLNKAFADPVSIILNGITVQNSVAYLYLAVKPHGQGFYANTELPLDQVRLEFAEGRKPKARFEIPKADHMSTMNGESPCFYALAQNGYEGKALRFLIRGCLGQMTITLPKSDWPPQSIGGQPDNKDKE